MILLVEPISLKIEEHIFAPPIPILELASYVTSKVPESEIRIIDMPADYGMPIAVEGKKKVLKKFIEDLAIIRPQAIGISYTAFVQAMLASETAKLIKQHFPEIMIFIGGYTATLFHEEMLTEIPEIDFAVIGDGEEALAGIAKALVAGKDPRDDGIPNLAWLENGKLHSTRKEVFDINNKQPIRLDMLRSKGAYMMLSYSESRGCPYRCNYCPEERVRPKYRTVPFDVFKSDITRLIKSEKTQFVLMGSPIFGCDKNFLADFTELFKALDAYFMIETRADTLTSNEFDKLINAGCMGVALGFESASYSTLRRMNKIKNPAQYDRYISRTEEMFKTAMDNDVFILMAFMLGYPGDTKEDLDDTVEFAKRLVRIANNARQTPGYCFKPTLVRVSPQTKLFDEFSTLQEMYGAEFVFEGKFKQNYVQKSSHDVDSKLLLEYQAEISLLSDITPSMVARFGRIMPLMRLPAEAYFSPLIKDQFYVDRDRTIFNFKAITEDREAFSECVQDLMIDFLERIKIGGRGTVLALQD